MIVRLPDPSHRIKKLSRLLQKKIAVAENLSEVEQRFLDVATQGIKDPEIESAINLYESNFQKEIIQAWIMSEATDEQIFNAIRVKQPICSIYRYIFFDITVFEHSLQKMEWINNYEGTQKGKNMLLHAATNGPKGMAWMQGNEEVGVSAKSVLKSTMLDAHFRGKVGRNAPLNSKEAAISHNYMQTAIKAASMLTRDDAEDMNALLIKLKHRDLTDKVLPEASENATGTKPNDSDGLLH